MYRMKQNSQILQELLILFYLRLTLFLQILLLLIITIIIYTKMASNNLSKNHTIDNKQRDLCTYFIKPCLPNLPKNLLKNYTDFQKISIKLVDALKKLSKTKRTKTNIEKLLLNSKFDEFVSILKQFKIDTKDLKQSMSLQIPSAQDFVRLQICEKYQQVADQLWAKYPKTGGNIQKMKCHVEWIMTEKQLDWETSDKQQKRFSLRKTIQSYKNSTNNQISENSTMQQQKQSNGATNMGESKVLQLIQITESNASNQEVDIYQTEMSKISSAIIQPGQFEDLGKRDQVQFQLDFNSFTHSWDPFNQPAVFFNDFEETLDGAEQ